MGCCNDESNEKSDFSAGFRCSALCIHRAEHRGTAGYRSVHAVEVEIVTPGHRGQTARGSSIAETHLSASSRFFLDPDVGVLSAGGEQTIHYMYRVVSPFNTILYKTCPEKLNEWDVIGLFAQPLDEDECCVYAFMLVYDSLNTATDLIQFQQMIFFQDIIILENQIPSVLPLQDGAERSIKADKTQLQYRKWLKKKGLQFGTHS